MRRVKAGFTLFLIAVSAHSVWAGATFDEVKASWQPSDTRILDRHGEELHRLRTDASVRRGQWVALADVSPALRTAMVLSEDKRFFEHSGVDWQAVSAAAWANLWNTRTRGASTITMQLAGLLDDDLKRSAGGRSVLQKVSQTVSAQWLERSWRKDQILEAYLNLVSFRGELVGIDALSQTLFGKAAHGLDAREAAVAAALVRAPNAKPAQVAQRACAVLASMALANAAKPAAAKPGSVASASATSAGASAAKPGAAKPGSVAPASTASAGANAASSDAAGRCDALAFFTTAALQRRDFAPSAGLAPHLARQVLATQATRPDRRTNSAAASKPTAGARAATEIRTTLLAPLQRFAVQTLQQHLRELDGRHVEDAALLVLDNASGEVLAWVGSSGELSRAGDVDAVTALRQPGSTLKPFLYAQAIAEGRLTAASLLEDSSTQIQTSGGLYIPQNYDRQFKGWVSVRTALGASLNVPAVRTLVMVSPDAFHQQLVKLGLPLPESGGYYGYSLALGSAEVSLLNLTNAYRSLANGGLHGPISLSWPDDRSAPPAQATSVATPSARQKPATLRQVIDARAAFIVSDILSDPLARARTFGMDSVLATRFWTAVKTGTSKDMRDNWALGYSQRYTVGVWVGNASGAPMWDVSGTTGAAPIWAALMNYLHRQTPSHPPRPPPGVIRTAVQFAVSGASANRPVMPEAARQEWFVQGTQQTTFAINLEASSAYASTAGDQKGLNSPAQQAVNAGT
ncbi:MAG TPA: transglycosylase domain-containing protein, partial [Rhodoferax sp.]|nr:transglycosylase domain-containing protein [Rhodoferax sp.]